MKQQSISSCPIAHVRTPHTFICLDHIAHLLADDPIVLDSTLVGRYSGFTTQRFRQEGVLGWLNGIEKHSITHWRNGFVLVLRTLTRKGKRTCDCSCSCCERPAATQTDAIRPTRAQTQGGLEIVPSHLCLSWIGTQENVTEVDACSAEYFFRTNPGFLDLRCDKQQNPL